MNEHESSQNEIKGQARRQKVEHVQNLDTDDNGGVTNSINNHIFYNCEKNEMDHAINNDIEEYGQPLQGRPWTALQAVSPNVPSLSFGLGPAVSPPQLKFESPDLGFLEYGRENQCSLLDFDGNDCLLPRSRHNESLVPLEYPAPLLNLESTPFEDNLPPYESDSGLLLRIESQSWGVTTPMDGKGHHAGAYFLDNMATQPATSAVATITLSDNGAAIICGGTPPLYSSTTPIDTAQTACLPDSNHENHFAGHVLRTFERRSKRSKKRRWVDLDVVSGVSHANHNLLQQTGAVQTHVFRGVSRHRLTHRWEASLWLNGKQMYLGGFDSQEDAARAYDLAALACKGSDALINFHAAEYESQLQEISGFSKEEVVAYVRRRSSAFSRGKSRYRGVSGHNNRWEARIGSFGGRKNVSFGVFESEEAAARQYDRALILEKGRNAKTNFPLRDYEDEVEEYVQYMISTCAGMSPGSASLTREVQRYTLPKGREQASQDERRKTGVIYAEALRRALS